ncbi:ATP12 family chaperone protein [Allomesorhizobium camelthorni]|uniref:ATPase n=1 Tax=Allomesorhizobium camelthorni TaxID=475069 RepID=A0A6G4WDZ2_9HYPH|nr:ATP12 family protein [Mesorhizobium camelthorni]NGO52413.1 ATPase [Mesorhizobium camelthorni]
MRDLLNDLDAQKYLSDPDPVRRAQSQMKTQLPKRFYKEVSVAAVKEGVAVHLDGKPVRTPGKAILALPTEKAAGLVAEEFAAQGEKIDPSTMPVYRLVNTAIDGVATDPVAVRDDVARFASSDLLCYRADAPAGLVERQAKAWDPLLEWAQRALGARLLLAEGVIHVEQPRRAMEAIGEHLALRQDPLRLAALHLMTTLTGSALLAMAVEAGEIDAETAWSAAHVDEDWQAEQWGQDSEAMARRAHRKRDMMAAASLIKAL